MTVSQSSQFRFLSFGSLDTFLYLKSISIIINEKSVPLIPLDVMRFTTTLVSNLKNTDRATQECLSWLALHSSWSFRIGTSLLLVVVVPFC